MSKLLVIAALLGSTLTPLSMPAAAAKGPKPPPSFIACVDVDDPGDGPTRICYYTTQQDCWAARRALHRQKVESLSPCYLVPDTEWEVYPGSWALRYAI